MTTELRPGMGTTPLCAWPPGGQALGGLDCSANGATCPDGMECFPISGGTTMVCVEQSG